MNEPTTIEREKRGADSGAAPCSANRIFTIDMELRGKHGQLLRGNFEGERAIKMLELFLECEELAASHILTAPSETAIGLASPCLHRGNLSPNAEVSDGGPLTHESPAAQSRRSLH